MPPVAAARVIGTPATNLPFAVHGAQAAPLSGCTIGGYKIPTEIGTQTFELILDSGSSDLWAVSGSRWPGLSPTYVPGPTSAEYGLNGYGLNGLKLQFVKGSAGGPVYRDQVAIPGLTQSTPFRVLAATSGRDLLTGPHTGNCFDPYSQANNAAQGVLGVGPDRGAHVDERSLISALVEGAAIDRNLLAVNLCNYGGEAWLGAFDPQAALSAPRMVAMPAGRRHMHHQMNIVDVLIGNESTQFPQSANPTTIDTGATVFLLPTAQYRQVFSQVGNLFVNSSRRSEVCWRANEGVGEAEINAQLPSMTVLLENDVVLEMPASLSYMAPFPGANATTVWCPQLGDAGQVKSGPIFGSAMMRGLSVIVDQTGGQVGFAVQDRSRCPAPAAYTPHIPRNFKQEPLIPSWVRPAAGGGFGAVAIVLAGGLAYKAQRARAQ